MAGARRGGGGRGEDKTEDSFSRALSVAVGREAQARELPFSDIALVFPLLRSLPQPPLTISLFAAAPRRYF